MMETRLTTTSAEGLQPLGSAAQRSFELVSETVRERLGPEHAMLFAEPVATENGDKIDWYAKGQGTAVRLSELETTEATEMRAQIGVLIEDIRAEADRLDARTDVQDQRLAEALRNALEIPDESMIYALRKPDGSMQPVLAHWAWLGAEQRSVRGILTAMVPRPTVAAKNGITGETGEKPASPAWWWLLLLGWVLLAVLLAWILYLVLEPCGLKGGQLFFCPEPAAESPVVLDEQRVIEKEIARLEHEIALLDRGCQPTIPLVPAATETAPTRSPTPNARPDSSETDAEERDSKAVIDDLDERGATRDKLNFALVWNSLDDIDLAVTCPTGATISYANRGDCNGMLDLDANVTRAEAIVDPVENIVFDQVVPGLYKVGVRLKSVRSDGVKPVTLHVLRDDGRSQTYSGTVSDKTPEWSVNISISR